MRLRSFFCGRGSGENKFKVLCDAGQVIGVAKTWCNGPWFEENTIVKMFLSKLLKLADFTLGCDPKRPIELSGSEDPPGNGDNNQIHMRFERSEIFRGLWEYIDKPLGEKWSYGELQKYCRKMEVYADWDVKNQS